MVVVLLPCFSSWGETLSGLGRCSHKRRTPEQQQARTPERRAVGLPVPCPRIRLSHTRPGKADHHTPQLHTQGIPKGSSGRGGRRRGCRPRQAQDPDSECRPDAGLKKTAGFAAAPGHAQLRIFAAVLAASRAAPDFSCRMVCFLHRTVDPYVSVSNRKATKIIKQNKKVAGNPRPHRPACRRRVRPGGAAGRAPPERAAGSPDRLRARLSQTFRRGPARKAPTAPVTLIRPPPHNRPWDCSASASRPGTRPPGSSRCRAATRSPSYG